MLIRTVGVEIGGSESEVGAYSDSRSRNRRGRVRRICTFRQKERKLEEVSPKLAHNIQTVGVETGEIESERGAHIDRIRGNRRKRVRTQSEPSPPWTGDP